MFKAFPAKRYHATEAPVYVQSEAEALALGPGWCDSPKAAAAWVPNEAPTEAIEAPCTATNDDGAVCTKTAGHRGRHVY